MNRIAFILILICSTALAQAPLPPANKLSLMRDTKITSPADKQVLTYVAVDSKWENLAAFGGAISNLTDVSLGALSAGNLLQWNGTLWTNHAPVFADLGGNISISQINGGSGASSTTWLCGDNTWKSPPTGAVAVTTNLLVGDGAGNAVDAGNLGWQANTAQLSLSEPTVGSNYIEEMIIRNLNGGTIAQSRFRVINNSGTSFDHLILSNDYASPPAFVTTGDSLIQASAGNIGISTNSGGVVKFSNDGGTTERLRIGNGLAVGTATDPGAGVVNVSSGFRIGNAAPVGHSLVGNGVSYVDAVGGGSGTVTNTGGALTANRVILGAGTNDVKVVAGILTDGTSKLTLGVAGTSVGSIDLKNATSGTVTILPATGALGTVSMTIPAANSNPVVPDTGAANNFLTGISSTGAITKAQPAFGNITGILAATRLGYGLAQGSIADYATITNADSVTSSWEVNPTMRLSHEHSGAPAPAAGMGARAMFAMDDSTTADTNAGYIGAAWTIAAHASYASKLELGAATGGTTPAGKAWVYGSGGMSVGADVDPGAGQINANSGFKVGGSPLIGGSNTQVLYNNSGAVGGITNATTNGTTLTLTAPTIVPPILMQNTGGNLKLTSTNASTGEDLSLRCETTNNRTALRVMPNGAPTNFPSAFEFFGTDFQADGTNFERFSIRARGSGDTYYSILTDAGGTGTRRAIAITADSTATQLVLSTTGPITIGGTDVGFSRNAAGVLEINSGTAGTFKDIKVDHANAVTGYRVNGAAALGYEIRGDGTDGKFYPTQISNSSTASQSATFAADTYLTGSNAVVAAGDFKAKGQYHCLFDMVKTAAGVAAMTIDVRIGTAGTTSDTSRIQFVFGAGTGVIDTGTFEVIVNWRTVGSGTSAVVSGICRAQHNLATTGLFNNAAAWTIVGTVSGGFDSSAATNIGLSVNGGASFSGTVTTVQAVLEQ